MATQINSAPFSLDVSFTTMQLLQVAQLAIVAGINQKLTRTGYDALVFGINAHVEFKPNEGRAQVKLNSAKIEIYFSTEAGVFKVTHARIWPIDGMIRRADLVLCGDYWDYYDLVNSKAPELYAEVMEGLHLQPTAPKELFCALKQIPLISYYERNVRNEEVVRLTYHFYGFHDLKVELYWAFGQHESGQPYDHFDHGVAMFPDGQKYEWNRRS